MVVGLLMVAYEDDILEEVLARHEEIVDVFYALDGTVPSTDSERIISASAKCAAYTRDADLRPTYGDTPRDGWRQHLYEQAVAEHGYENWFALLHGDEVWTFDPRDVVQEGVDGYVFPLPCYIPRDPWDYDRTPIEQLEWFLDRKSVV